MAISINFKYCLFSSITFITEMISSQEMAKDQQTQPKQLQQNHSVLTKVCDFTLNELRHSIVYQVIKARSVKRVLDVGCNTGQFVKMLSRSPKLELIVGMDCDQQSVLKAISNAFPEMIQSSIQFDRDNDLKVLIYKGDLTKESSQLQNMQFEAITMIEVIEHLPIDVIPQASQIVFGFLRPPLIIISTPNKEFNVHFGSDPNQFRHWDHKFEWTRKEFESYCESIKQKYGYSYELRGIGEHISDSSLGSCTQMAIFSLQSQQYQLEFQYVQSIEEKQLAKIQLELRAEYTISCWKSKINQIMLDLFYTGISYQIEETFEELLQYIKAVSLLSRNMQKNGQQLSISFLKKFISKFSELFEWNEQKYWARKRQTESIKSQQLQHQRQLQQFLASSPYLSFPQHYFQDSSFSVSASVLQPILFKEFS